MINQNEKKIGPVKFTDNRFNSIAMKINLLKQAFFKGVPLFSARLLFLLLTVYLIEQRKHELCFFGYSYFKVPA